MSNKLSNTDIIEELIGMLEDDEKEILKKAINDQIGIKPNISKSRTVNRIVICNAMFNCLHEFTEETENKKYIRQLIKKYMSNTSLREGEKEGYDRLYKAIMDEELEEEEYDEDEDEWEDGDEEEII